MRVTDAPALQSKKTGIWPQRLEIFSPIRPARLRRVAFPWQRQERFALPRPAQAGPVPRFRRLAFLWPRQARFALPRPAQAGPVRPIRQLGSFAARETLPMAAPAVAVAHLEPPHFPTCGNPGPLNHECLPRPLQARRMPNRWGSGKQASGGWQGRGPRLDGPR